MKDLFHTAPLLPKEAHLAYPLVQMSNPAMPFREWLSFARSRGRVRRAQPAGLMAVRDRRGILHALYSYRVDTNMRRETCLRIADLVIARLPGEGLDRAVLFGIQQLAEELACTTVLVDVPVPATNSSAIARLIGRAGPGLVPSAISVLRRSPERLGR